LEYGFRTKDNTKCHFLEMLPMEIRFRVFDLLVAPLETAEVSIQIEHTEKKMGDDLVIVLSKTCKQMQGEYQAWLKSHPTLRLSPRYGLFVPERTTFFMSFRPRTYRNLSYNRAKAALPVFERFCQEPAHADVRKVTVDYGWLGDRSAFIRMARCMRAFNHLEIFEVITPISDGKRCGWYDWETYEETFTSESWDDLKGAGFKDGGGRESLCFVVTDSVVFHETWVNVVELGAEASVF
jgi:hypothetical protein